jgi:hypothetical protein
MVGRLLFSVVFATGLGALTLGQSQMLRTDADRQAALRQQIVSMRQECLTSTRAAAIAASQRRQDAAQRAWCEDTRAVRREDFRQAFVESLRQAKSGGNGLAKALDRFTKEHPESIKPALANTVVCADGALTVDPVLVPKAVNEPSLLDYVLGVRLRGNQVSRLNPVSRWDQLVKEGIVIRSSQMQYSTPMPVQTQADTAQLIQETQGARCPAGDVVDPIVEQRIATRDSSSDASTFEADSREFADVMLKDARMRQRLDPLMQMASFPTLSVACAQSVRPLLTYDDLARRMTAELLGLANPAALHRTLVVMRTMPATRWFTTAGALRLFQPDNDELTSRVADVYGADGQPAWLVDAALTTSAANQAFALAMAAWSSARSAASTQSCAPN